MLFRIRIEGAENIPDTGGALLVSNHISYSDAVLVGYTTPRIIRFLMWRPIYEAPLLNYFFRVLRAIPIDAAPPKAMVRALRAAHAELTSGELVAIFPEGGISQSGDVGPFERGFERILDGTNAPVIPMYAQRALWPPIKPLRRWPFPELAEALAAGGDRPDRLARSRASLSGAVATDRRGPRLRPTTRVIDGRVCVTAHRGWKRYAVISGGFKRAFPKRCTVREDQSARTPTYTHTSPAETLTRQLLVSRLRLRSRANLPQKGSKIEVDPSRRNPSGSEVVFVEGAARNRNLPARCLDFGKGAFMHGFKTPFHRDQILSVGQVPNGMYIARKRGDKRAHKVVSHGCLPFKCSRREVGYHVIRIVGENLVLISAFPGIEILLDKRADVFRRRLDSHSLHTDPLSRYRDGGAVRASIYPSRARTRHQNRRFGK